MKDSLAFSAHKTKFAPREALMIMETSQDQSFLHHSVSFFRAKRSPRGMRRQPTDSSMCNPLNSICKAKQAGSIHTLMSRFSAKWSRKNRNPVKKPPSLHVLLKGGFHTNWKRTKWRDEASPHALSHTDKSLRVRPLHTCEEAFKSTPKLSLF